MIKETLESLDTLILNNVFEPITQYAHKTLGWTKYDLAGACLQGAGAMLLGTGVYHIAYASMGGSPLWMGIGGLFAFLGLGGTALAQKWKSDEERKEMNLYVKTGAVRAPQINYRRAMNFFTSQLIIFPGVVGTAYADEQKSTIGCLALTLYGAGELTAISMDYFENTTFIPPKQGKKKLWKSLYEGIKNKIPGVKVPQTAEVTVPNRYEGLEKVNTTEI